MRHTRGDLRGLRKLGTPEGEPMDAKESAEGEVVPPTGTKARTCRDGEDLNSMDGADADKHG